MKRYLTMIVVVIAVFLLGKYVVLDGEVNDGSYLLGVVVGLAACFTLDIWDEVHR